MNIHFIAVKSTTTSNLCIGIFFLASIFSYSIQGQEDFRNWKTADGKFETVGRYKDFSQGKVSIEKKTDQSVIEVDLEILSLQDQAYVEKARRKVVQKQNERSQHGERYALLVGVKQYNKESGLRPLAFTENDVTKMAELLYQSGYRPENIVLMTETKARVNARFLPERDKILREIRNLIRDRKPEDSLLIAFAGHGVQFEGNDDNFFCPLDARVEKTNTLISMKELYNELENCQAGIKMLFVDACRNDPILQSARGLDLLEEGDRVPLQPPTGIAAFFSCSEKEAAYEDANLKHGVFFHFLIEAMLGSGDLDKDNAISLPELELYVKRRVSDYVRDQFGGNRQMPNLKGNTQGLVDIVNLPDLENLKPTMFAELHGPSRKITVNGIGMTFVQIDGGDGWMGHSEIDHRSLLDGLTVSLGPRPARASEPLHLVRITKPYQIGMHEVTQTEYERVMGTNPSFFCKQGDGKKYVEGMDTRRFPVEKVSWNDAVTFCRKLSELPEEKAAGRVYRLPTEAEWEYACRGLGKDAPLLKRLARENENSHGMAMNISEELRNELAFHFGSDDTQLDAFAWYKENAEGMAQLVESKKPNQFGLYDMHGNVWEWCGDWYGHSYFEAHQEFLYPYLRKKLANGLLQPGHRIWPEDTLGAFGNGATALKKIPFRPVLDPMGPSDEDVNRNKGKAPYWEHRVIRGGGWESEYNNCVADFRGSGAADQFGNNIGFRVVMLLAEDTTTTAQYAAVNRPAPVLLEPTPDEVIAAMEKLGRTRLNKSWLKKDRTVEYYQNVDGSQAVVRVFLNGTLVADADLVHLKGLTNLELLNLNDTTVTGVGLVHLKGLTKLKILDLSKSEVSDAGLTHLKGLNNLSELDLTNTNVTAAGAKKLQQALPKCRITLPRLAPAKTPAAVKKQITPAQLALGDPVVNSVGMRLAPIPAGKFTMGRPEKSRYRGNVFHSIPSHLVTLTKPFYLGVYEVTQEQYERVMGANPSEYKGAQLPVDTVSWGDAAEFCRKLSALPKEKAAGRVYRLPTEAEWEYACRAGTTTEYSFGDEPSQLFKYGWYARNSEREVNKRFVKWVMSSHTVGQKKPNPWGLYDMHGNVWEWCLDNQIALARKDSNLTDPTGPSPGRLGALRGGSAWDPAEYTTAGTTHRFHGSADRLTTDPEDSKGGPSAGKRAGFGFRVAMNGS